MEEVHLRLHTSKITSSPKIKDALSALIESGIVKKDGNYVYINSDTSFSKERTYRSALSQKKQANLNKILPLITHIPFIEAILLTGSVAANNADLDDDIDLLVIASANRLWIVRLLLILIFEIIGIRRRPGAGHINNKVCLNLFLESGSLHIPKQKQSIYSAYELLQSQALYEKTTTMSEYLSENRWVKEYLANWYDFRVRTLNSQISEGDKLKTQGIADNILFKINHILYRIQIRYMKKRKTLEYVKPNQVFFHPDDNNGKLLRKFELLKKSFY